MVRTMFETLVLVTVAAEVTNLGGLKLAEGGRIGRELRMEEGGGTGAVREVELESRICLAWRRAARRAERLYLVILGYTWFMHAKRATCVAM